MTVQVTMLLLQRKIRKIGMNCFAKHEVREDSYIARNKEFFNNMLYVRYLHLTKGQAYS
jgi:hypothetical protein